MTLKLEIRGGGIPSGVIFLSLPDDWLCPECSAGKDEFALVEL
jgi:rubredoxin